MAAGIKALRKIQLGREGTAGSECDATVLWRGTGTIEDGLTMVFPEEDIGMLCGVDRNYIPKVEARLAMDETPCTFEHVCHILEAGVETATVATSGGGQQYVYTFPTTAANTIKNYTVEGGDDIAEEQFLYGFVTDFTLSGSAGEAVMMSANWLGRQVSSGTFTTGGITTATTVEEVLFQKGQLFLDPSSGTLGTTTAVGTWLDFNLKVNTGWVPVYTGDGQLYFTHNKSVAPELLCDVTFEHEATVAVAEIAAWRAKTPRLMEMKFTGAALTTTGATYAVKTMKIDLTGKWESFEKIGERDGNDVVTGSFRTRYNATDATFATITVVHNNATLI